MQRKGMELGTSCHRGLIGKPEDGLFTREFVGQALQDYEKGESPLWDLCEGNLEGGLLYWRLLRICKGRLWKRASLTIWDPWGDHGWGIPLPGTLKGQNLLYEGTMFIRDLEAYVKDGSGNGNLTPLRPQQGTWRQGSFNGEFRNGN